jgi:hypothetical protein
MHFVKFYTLKTVFKHYFKLYYDNSIFNSINILEILFIYFIFNYI